MNLSQKVRKNSKKEDSVTKSRVFKEKSPYLKINKMGLLGRGHGYFGLSKSYNFWIRLIVIILFFGFMGIFLISIKQSWAGLISFGVGFMFILFNNLVKD